MNGEEILRLIPFIEKSSDQIDFKSLNYRWDTVKRRKVLRKEERSNKTSKEGSKKVALRLHGKLIKRGLTPNLNANFYAKGYFC